MSIFANMFDRRHPGVPFEFPVTPQLVHWLDTTPIDSTDQPCTVRSLDVQARVRGIHAEVVQTIQIANPNRRPLSTSLSIPLPDRAVVCGYALEIDGQLVEGVVVPKEKARVIFESEQRRQADPGLVEAVRGNVYSTRVYPVPAYGTRTVRLSYVTPLTLGPNGSATLELAMPNEHLDQRTMRISVEKLDVPAPRITGLSGAELSATTHDWSVETTESDVTPVEPVRVDLPSLPASFALLERDDDGTTWFCVSHEQTEASGPASDDQLVGLTVLWDASGSRTNVDHAAEYALIKAYGDAPQLHDLTLVVFADHVRGVRSFSSARKLVKHLKKLAYDGGTSFGALSRCEALQGAAQEGIAAGHACVLFTDGMDTLGEETFSLPEGLSVLAVVSGDQRDAEALRQGCRGPVVAPDQAPQTVDALVKALHGAGRHGVADVRGKGIADVCDVSSAEGSRRAVIGRLTGEEATLHVGKQGEKLALRASDAREGRVLSRAWAARRITLLSPRSDENADELLRLGRRYGMASPATSLLVLETLDQWLRYEVEPPRSLTRMHADWTRAMEGRMQLSSKEAREEGHRRNLASAWSEVMRWWARDYSVAAQTAQGNGASGPDFCPYCGMRVEHSTPFCANCGHPLNRPQSAREGFRPSHDMPLYSASAPSFDAFEASAPDFDAFEDAAPDAAFEGSGFTAEFLERPPRPMSASMAGAPAAGMARASMASLSAASPRMARAASAPGPREPSGPSMRVKVEAWMPDAPYLKSLDKAADPDDPQPARDAYLDERREHSTSPSFFLDCAGWFFAHDDEDFGASVLTNLAELRIEDAGMLHIMAWRLREAGRLEEALVTLRRVQKLREEDSQGHRDLALLLTELARDAYAKGDEAAAKRYAEEAGELYRKTALTPWDRRPLAIALFAVEEYNVLRAWAQAQSWKEAPELPSLGSDLEGVPDCDLRITLAWDADETDVDIHVTEPSGEEAYYAHRNTSSGGRVSEDITDGYGPELYEIRRARGGVYRIRAHYFASHQQTVFGPATCTLTVYSDWGRPNQTQSITTTRLERAREMITVGTASYGAAASNATDGEPSEASTSNFAVGMSPSEVREILGEPDQVEREEMCEIWIWRRSGGHELIAVFDDDELEQLVERMPWGDEMIVVQ